MILTKVQTDSVDLDFLINGKINSGSINEFLLIVPTNRKIRSLKREIISLTPSLSSSKMNLETLGTFATNFLFKNNSNANRVLSEAASAILLKQSFREVGLKYFSLYKKEIPHGTLDRIRDVISEYKKHGISSADIKRESESLTGTEKIKAEDIASIYENYLNKCKNLNVKEIGDIYNEVIRIDERNFNEIFREIYPDVNLIVVNGFDEFTSPEIEIINFLACVKNSRLYVSFDYYSYNPLLFSHLDKCYKKLVKKGFKAIHDISPALKNKFQSEIREKLFTAKKKNKISTFQNSITKINAASREKEVEMVAKEVKELILEKNVEPQKICIVFNLIKKYSPFVRDIFNVYGIPFNLTDRIQLSSSSPVISIINFLEIIENDFYYKNIFRALSGGYLRIPEIDISNLLNVSVGLKIISGYDNWINSIGDAINEIEYPEDDEDNYYKYNKYSLERASDDLKKLHKILLPFSKSLTLNEFIANITGLIYSLSLPVGIINDESEMTEENVKAVTSFFELLDEIFELFELEFGRDKKFPLSFFLNNIRTAVASSRFNIKEKPGYGVQVTTLNEIRGLKFDYLFIAGLCDGDMPTRFTPEIFLSGSYARSEFNHHTEERYQFYQSLCSWEKHLYLTCPAQEDKKELAESNFLEEFSNMFSVIIKSEKDYYSTVYSKEELLIELGKDKNNDIPEHLDLNEYNINNEKLKKSISVSKLRLNNPFGESEYTGIIKENLSDSGKEELKDFEKREFSISQLETYAKCPYKYFAERVLNLKPVKEPTEEIEALEMGSLIHKILYKFYTRLQKEKIILNDIEEEKFNYAEDMLFNIAGEIIEEAHFNSPLTFFEKEKILGINNNRKNSILYKFLINEKEKNGKFVPSFFEAGFGNVGTKSKEITAIQNIKVSDINVRGKIDRIDINEQDKYYKVVDYKLSGKKPSSSELNEGISLQLPLYMFAAKEMIKAQINKDLEPAGAEIYSLKFDEKDFGRKLIGLFNSRSKLDDKQIVESSRELIDICKEMLRKYVNAIIEGKFNLSTLNDRENKVCRYCDFRSICRIQEIN
jgi:ATP-dependent helicase/nuclease subunit B